MKHLLWISNVLAFVLYPRIVFCQRPASVREVIAKTVDVAREGGGFRYKIGKRFWGRLLSSVKWDG